MAGGGADGKVKKRTLANITHWVPAKIEALRRLLRDEAPSRERRLKLLRSLPHGHVAAALGLLRKSASMICCRRAAGSRGARRRCASPMVARLIDPASKLATARLLDGATATCSLGAVLGLGAVDEQALYDALDWLTGQQERIEKALARRHLGHGTLVLLCATGDDILPATTARDDGVIFFTSGTSDRPKGVVLSYREQLGNIEPMTQGFGITGSDCIYDFRSFNWASAQLLGVLAPLCRGATLVMAKKFSATRFFDDVRAHTASGGRLQPTPRPRFARPEWRQSSRIAAS